MTPTCLILAALAFGLESGLDDGRVLLLRRRLLDERVGPFFFRLRLLLLVQPLVPARPGRRRRRRRARRAAARPRGARRPAR